VKRQNDLVAHRIGIVQNFIIPEPQNPKPLIVEPAVASDIR
jgi:hypothetical protein